MCASDGTMTNEPGDTLTDTEIWDKIEGILSSIVIAESSRPELQGGGICVGVTNVKSTCVPKIGTHTPMHMKVRFQPLFAPSALFHVGLECLSQVSR